MKPEDRKAVRDMLDNRVGYTGTAPLVPLVADLLRRRRVRKYTDSLYAKALTALGEAEREPKP